MTTIRTTLATVALTLFLVPQAPAVIVSVSLPVAGWQSGPGGPAVSRADTASPVWGSGAADSADNSFLYAAFAPIGLTGNNSTLSVIGSIELIGITSSGNQLKIGLFHSGGSTTDLGWTGGYFYSASSGNVGGTLMERRANAPGTNFMDTTAATTQGAAFYDLDRGPLVDGIYSFQLTLTRFGDGAVNLTMALAKRDGSYYFSRSYFDTTPFGAVSLTPYYLDRVGFLSGGNLNADQIRLSGVTLIHDYEQVPEPGVAGLAAAGLFVGFLRQRRRR